MSANGLALICGVAIASLIVLIGASRRLWQTLSESRTELERRVAERTYALQLLNEALHKEISDREHAEEALRASEEQFRQIFMTTPIPVWLYDLKTGRFLEVNDIAVRNYGYSHAEFLEMSIADIQPDEAESYVVSARLNPTSLHGSAHCGQHRRKDGRVMDVEISSHAVTFARQSAVLMAALDISDRKQMEVELRHAQKLEAVGALAAGIAHEINTPIQFVGDNARFLQNAFGGLRQLLDRYEAIYVAVRKGSASDELVHAAELARVESDWEYSLTEIPKALEQALQGIDRVAKIVRAMKEFSHVNQHLEKRAADLNRAVESTLIVARNELKYVAEVETVYADLPPVICHLGDLNQVFLNLLINAAHAIGDVVKDSGQKGRIRVHTRQIGSWVEISISDTGTGIPKAIHEKIFDPFFTTKEVGKGSGQGLALARAIVVEKHGGTLTFETEPGKGTTFHVRLPISDVNASWENLAQVAK